MTQTEISFYLFTDFFGKKHIYALTGDKTTIEVSGLTNQNFESVYYQDKCYFVDSWCKENNISYKIINKTFTFDELNSKP